MCETPGPYVNQMILFPLHSNTFMLISVHKQSANMKEVA